MLNKFKTGIVTSSIFTEEENIPREGKQINDNILTGNVIIYTNSSGTISSLITRGSISGERIKQLEGKTLCFSYEVCTLGDRYSTEQGQTSWDKTRYGMHASIQATNSSGATTQYYPFADNLNYSGDYKRVVMTWTVPTGFASFTELGFAVQNFDKPASTNKNIWFIRNIKLEVSNHATGYILNYSLNNNRTDWTANKEFLEI